MREAVAWALSTLGDGRTVEPLIAVLGDEDRAVRKAAAGALSKLGDARAVEPLVAALGDEDRAVRKVAAKALKTITGQDFGKDAARWRQWWKKQRRPTSSVSRGSA